ncbi:MAG: sugar ABC transporter permease [Spirochaetales bacterium]|nr:sugar ABC transporter permease [Spirochaetales bacterium]
METGKISLLNGILRKKSSAHLVWILFLIPALLVYSIFMAFPLFQSIRLSFFTGKGLRPDNFVGFDNYVSLFTDPVLSVRFYNALRNTFIFFGIHMFVQNTLGLLFASFLASKFKGHSVYRTIIFMPTTLSTLVIGFIWTLILNPQWGALNKILTAVHLDSLIRPWLGDTQIALPIISLISSWQWVSLPTMMFVAALFTVSDEIVESAMIDGASNAAIFWRFKIPLILPVIGIVSVLTFVGNFTAFDIIFAMATHRGEPMYSTDLLGTFFYRTAIAGEHPVAEPNMGVGAALATVTFLLLLTGVLTWLFLSRKQRLEANR